MTKLLLIGLLILYGTGCSEEREVWKGHVYPDRYNLSNDELIGDFDSLVSCRKRANQVIRDRGYTNADYECGLNC